MSRKIGRRMTATAKRLTGLAATARQIAGLPLELHRPPAYRWVHYLALGILRKAAQAQATTRGGGRVPHPVLH